MVVFTQRSARQTAKLTLSRFHFPTPRVRCEKGIDLPPLSLEDFIASLASSRSQVRSPREKPYVTFPEFRDYLLLLPRKPSVSEVSGLATFGSSPS